MANYPAYCSACKKIVEAELERDQLYCIPCGAFIEYRRDPKRRAATRRAKAGANWVDPLWLDDNLSQRQRCDRLRTWLRDRLVTIPEDVLEVLANCKNGFEVQFVLPFLATSGWRRIGPRFLTNDRIRIQVQEPVCGYIVGFVLEDFIVDRRYAIEINKSHQTTPAQSRQDRQRDQELSKAGYIVVRFPGREAKQKGLSFRRDLMREQLRSLQRAGGPAVSTGKQKFWSGHDLAYDVSDSPYEARYEMLSDWLRSRRVQLPGEQVAVLAHCDRAGEILFALQLLSISSWTRTAERTLSCGAYELIAQHAIGSYRVDFLLRRVGANLPFAAESMKSIPLRTTRAMSRAMPCRTETSPIKATPCDASGRARRSRWAMTEPPAGVPSSVATQLGPMK